MILLVLLIGLSACNDNTALPSNSQTSSTSVPVESSAREESVGEPSVSSEPESKQEEEPILETPVLPEQGSLDDFIPEGWVPTSVDLDFNADDITDLVGILEPPEELQRSRILFVLAGEEDGRYRLDIQVNNAVRNFGEGGMKLDPLDYATVDGSAFTINASGGGGSIYWEEETTYGYQNGEWLLHEVFMTSALTLYCGV